MDKEKLINQLKSLIENSKSLKDENETDSLWDRDIEALNIAIHIINKSDKFIQALKEVRTELRCIDGPNEADGYIDESLNIIKAALEGCELD